MKSLLLFCTLQSALFAQTKPESTGPAVVPYNKPEGPGRRILLEGAFSYAHARSTVTAPYASPILEREWFSVLGAGIFSPDASRRQITALQILDNAESKIRSRKFRLQGAVEIFSWLDGGLFASLHRYTATGFRHEVSDGSNGYFLFLRQASAIASSYPDRFSLNLPANGFDAAYFVRGNRTFQTVTNGFFASLHKRMGSVDPYFAIGATALSRNNAYAAAGLRFFASDNVYLQCEGYSEAVRMRIPDYSAGGSTYAAMREEGIRVGAGFTFSTKTK